jgi:prevent-host-death family protein
LIRSGAPRHDLDTFYGQSYFRAVKRIAAAKFKEQCLALLDRVGPEGLVITKHGKPVAKLVPIESDSKELIGALRGKLTIRGDILSTGVRWNVES